MRAVLLLAVLLSSVPPASARRVVPVGRALARMGLAPAAGRAGEARVAEAVDAVLRGAEAGRLEDLEPEQALAAVREAWLADWPDGPAGPAALEPGASLERYRLLKDALPAEERARLRRLWREWALSRTRAEETAETGAAALTGTAEARRARGALFDRDRTELVRHHPPAAYFRDVPDATVEFLAEGDFWGNLLYLVEVPGREVFVRKIYKERGTAGKDARALRFLGGLSEAECGFRFVRPLPGSNGRWLDLAYTGGRFLRRAVTGRRTDPAPDEPAGPAYLAAVAKFQATMRRLEREGRVIVADRRESPSYVSYALRAKDPVTGRWGAEFEVLLAPDNLKLETDADGSEHFTVFDPL